MNGPSGGGRRAALFAAATFAVALVVGAGLMEGVVRLYAAIDHRFAAGFREFDPMAVQIEPHGTRGYRQQPKSIFHYVNGTSATSNALGYRGPVVPPHPAAGTVRIILLGGSTTHGWGVPDDQTLDARMRAILRERYPTRSFEVVNLAFDGYDSYQMLERLRTDGLGMQPTIIVLNEGINDVRNAQFPNLRNGDPRTLIWETVLVRLRDERRRGGPTLWTRLKHYSYLARTPGYVREQLLRRSQPARRTDNQAAGTEAAEPNGADGDAPHGPPYPDAADYFDKNMRLMVDLGLQQGAAILLSTPPSALRSYPPNATSTQSYWVVNAKTTQAYRDELARRLRGIAADEQANHRRVAYVAPAVPKADFLDDCHLTGDGNALEAATFVDAIMPLLEGRPTSKQPALTLR